MSFIDSSSFTFSHTPPFLAPSEKETSMPSFEPALCASLMESRPRAMTREEIDREIKIIFKKLHEGQIGTFSQPFILKRSEYNEKRPESDHAPRSFLLFRDPAHAYEPCAVIFLNKKEDGLAFYHGLSTTKQYKEGRLFYPLSDSSVKKVIVVTQSKTKESLNETYAHILFRDSPFITRLRTSYVHTTTYVYTSNISDTVTKSYIHIRENVVQIFDYYPLLDLYEYLGAHMSIRNYLGVSLIYRSFDTRERLEFMHKYEEEQNKRLLFSCASLLCTARALVEMHKAGYAHRDIKPENILGARDNLWRLSDLSSAFYLDDSVLPDTYFHLQGAVEFISPEKAAWYLTSLEKRKETSIDLLAADVWALSTTALDILTEQVLPWHKSREQSTFKQLNAISALTQEYINSYIESVFGDLPIKHPFKEALLSLLIVDPTKRPTALQAEAVLTKLCEKYLGKEGLESIPALPKRAEEFLIDDDL